MYGIRRIFTKVKNKMLEQRLKKVESDKWKHSKEIWENIGKDEKSAFKMMDGSQSEEELQRKGRVTAEKIVKGLAIDKTHKVLEIGCGVGRIGRELAPQCKEWFGVDISSTLIKITKKRMAHLNNVQLAVLDKSFKLPFPDDTFDRVYCHVVLMHIQNEDMYTYFQEIKRVLKPKCIAFYDAFNLNTEDGWNRFLWEYEQYKGKYRPMHRSRFTTPQEIRRYTEKAGLEILFLREPIFWVEVIATKLPDTMNKDEERISFLNNLRKGLESNLYVLNDIQ